MGSREVVTPMTTRRAQVGDTSTMQLVIGRLLRGLAWLILLGFALEVYLVGTRLFGVTTFQPHRTLGILLAIPILLLPVLALVARRGRHVVGLSGLLVALAMLQYAMPVVADSFPWVAALHAINTMALMGVTMSIARAPAAKTTPIEVAETRLPAHEQTPAYRKPAGPVAPQL